MSPHVPAQGQPESGNHESMQSRPTIHESKLTNSANKESSPNKKIVVLVGPSSERYKGGIAQFTRHLADVLAERTQLLFFSWYKLYPYFLSSRDFLDRVSEKAVGTSNAQFTLGYMNPLSWFRTLRKIAKADPDIVILTWIHPVHAPIYLVFNFFLRRFTRAEVVYLCHNVLPHELFLGAKKLAKHVLRGADRVLVHGKSEAEVAKSLAPSIPVCTLFLPLHSFFETSDNRNDVNEESILFFGVIRPYKGLDILLRALPLVIKTNPEVKLTIAGEFLDPTITEDASTVDNPLQLIQDLGLEQSVSTQIRYIPNEEVPRFFQATDLAVFPYRSASQSGGLTVAYSFGVPVIATKVGGLSDVVEEGVSGFLIEPEDHKALAQAIIRFFKSPIPSDGVRQYAKGLSWDEYVERLLRPGKNTVASQVDHLGAPAQ